MKQKIRPDDASMLQMNDWLAELREDDRPGPLAVSHTKTVSSSLPPQVGGETAGPAAATVPAKAVVPTYRPAPAAAVVPTRRTAEDAVPVYRAMPGQAAVPVYRAESAQAVAIAPSGLAAEAPHADPADHADHADAPDADPTVRSVIGDQLRMPIMWCELGSCISSYADPAARGEADNRVRAIESGWRVDGFGRLACPRCQQTDPAFRVSGPVVPWDRHTAVARASRIAAGG